MGLSNEDKKEVQALAESLTEAKFAAIKKDTQAAIGTAIEAFAKKVEALVDGKVDGLGAGIAEQVKIDLLASGATAAASAPKGPPAITDALKQKALELAPTLYREKVLTKAGDVQAEEEHEYKHFRIVGDEIHADGSRKHQPGKWLIRRVLVDAGLLAD